jgi:hypothetical protein
VQSNALKFVFDQTLTVDSAQKKKINEQLSLSFFHLIFNTRYLELLY